MKYILVFFMLASPYAFAQSPEAGKGIRFEHGSFSELLAQAKKENKLIMVDAYTTWCGPCKWMVKNIFPNDTVGEFYNKNFVNAKIDMEKGEGMDLAKKYNVSCYPTYLFINGNGELMHRVSSAMPAAEFVELGKSAMDPSRQFVMAQKKYDAGGMTPDEMAGYVLMRGRSCLPVKDEMAKYFSTQKDEDLTAERNWNMFRNHITDLRQDSREFRYLTEHRDEYVKKYRAGQVDTLIMSAYNFALYNHIRDKNYEAYTKLRTDIAPRASPLMQESMLNMDLMMYKAKKDWKNYTNTATEYIDKYKKDNAGTLNNIAWTYYEEVDDKAMLAKAEGWAKRSVDLKADYFNCDTYAAVLFKLGKKPEAKAMAEKAIALGKKDGEDVKSTEELLGKINAMK